MFLSAMSVGASARTLRVVLVCAVVGLASAAWAQDTRVVTEPKIPATCVKLEARIAAVGDTLKEADEANADTARLQAAIDGFAATCKPGQAVELAAGAKGANAFLSGPFEIKEGVTLLVDKGVTLFASRNPLDYDVSAPGTCGTIPSKGPCKAFITIRAKNVGIMGDGIIDGRGGAKLLGRNVSWWGLAVQGEPTADRPNGIPYSDPRLISVSNADGFTMYRITLHDSPNFHVGVSRTDGFTAWGVHLKTPVHEPGPNDPRPRNTDGIDPGSSTNITIAHSWIDNGDDNVAIKTGVTHMSVIDNHFYSGHGMSIGSETNTGVSALLVDGLTEDHTTSGIRIKSNATRGGLVENLTYKNICMRDVGVPIAISPYYNNQTIEGFVDPGIKGTRIPEYRNITLENITDLTPGDVLIAGYDQDHRTQVNLIDVTFNGMTLDKMHLKLADIGNGGTNLPLDKAAEGNDVKVTPDGKPAPKPYSCTGKFLPMQ
ncbi:MAG: glycosyl hydrolase family 28 protein [Acidobacteriaceae bacterium]|jgi:polygalacturonase